MKEQERKACKQIGIGVALVLLAGALGYWINPLFYALALLGLYFVVTGWTDTATIQDILPIRAEE